MAATAAIVAANRRKHEAAEAEKLADGTPRTLKEEIEEQKKPKKKKKKVEIAPTLPYQKEMFDFYQGEKVQIFVAVRGSRAAASRHSGPLSCSPGICTTHHATRSTRWTLTTAAPPHAAPRPNGCSCLSLQTSFSWSRRRSTTLFLTMCGRDLRPPLPPLSATPLLSTTSCTLPRFFTPTRATPAHP